MVFLPLRSNGDNMLTTEQIKDAKKRVVSMMEAKEYVCIPHLNKANVITVFDWLIKKSEEEDDF